MHLPISLNDHPSERQNQKAPHGIPKSHRLERMACFCENILKIWKFSLQEHTKFSLVPPPLQEKKAQQSNSNDPFFTWKYILQCYRANTVGPYVFIINSMHKGELK